MVLALSSVEEQLVEIYFKYETWHKQRMSYDDALFYHLKRLLDGRIYAYVVDGIVLGYYEREFNGEECFLKNVVVIPGFKSVFKQLYRHFFKTMPLNIKYIAGEKQKLGGKWMRAQITNARRI